MRVTLVLTHQCNLACTYCYAGEKFDRAMPDPVAWKALSMAFCRGTGPVRVSFFGGEPMLEFARMARWTRLAARLSRETGREVEYSLTTNGTVMQEKHVRFFQHYRFHVAISLDGAGEAHDRYRPFVGGRPSSASVWRGVERAAAVLDRLSVLMVLNPDTVGAVPDAVERLHALDVARVLLVPNLDDPWDLAARARARAVYHELARRYVALREADHPLYVHPFVDLMRRRLLAASGAGSGSCSAKHSCGFGLDEVAVAPSGRLYPCARLVGTDTRRDILLGDVSHGVDVARVTAVRDRAIAAQTRCGNEGECLCVPMMPATSDAMLDGAKFFEQLSVEALDAAMAAREAVGPPVAMVEPTSTAAHMGQDADLTTAAGDAGLMTAAGRAGKEAELMTAAGRAAIDAGLITAAGRAGQDLELTTAAGRAGLDAGLMTAARRAGQDAGPVSTAERAGQDAEPLEVAVS